MQVLVTLFESSFFVTVFGMAVFLAGGWFVLARIEIARARMNIDVQREHHAQLKQVELVRAVREQQYAAVSTLYTVFGEFMELYRLSQMPEADIAGSSPASLLNRAIKAEAIVDALILRIGAEFALEGREVDFASELGSLRQACQYWREQFERGHRIEFHSSENAHYQGFKRAFSRVAARLVAMTQSRLEVAERNARAAESLLLDAFSNRHEGGSLR